MKKILIVIAILIPGLAAAQNNQQIQLANEYYVNGDFAKAKDVYDELAKNSVNIPDIHNNYFNVLMTLNEYSTLEKYLKKTLKQYPSNVYYRIDEGIYLKATNHEDQANKIYEQLIVDIRSNGFLIRTAAQYFISKQLTEFAKQTYLEGRKHSGNPEDYALELANAYRILGEKEKMVNEYLAFASLRPQNLRYVKNLLQNILQDEEDMTNFQKTLLVNIQKYPNDNMYSDLLIWAFLQQKDFHGAFIQARAITKRMKENGYRLMDIGAIALTNGNFVEAEEIFEYIVENMPESRFYISARQQLIKVRQEKVKSTFPIDYPAIRKLTTDYQQLIREMGLNQETLEAYRQKALLHAFYLDEKDSAITILNEIISIPRADLRIKSMSKLDLGDIYILIDEPWEATLLYSQVEKTNKSSKIGYEAKFKNAQLNYFMGNFELAKSHLDILKNATTKEIANDAMSLSLLIQNNTALDTSDFVLKKYADIERVVFQNKLTEAKTKYQQMLVDYPGHSLTDEIYWQLAQVNMTLGEFENALLNLEVIETKYGNDIYGDDAMFLKAKVLEENLLNKEQAMDVYKDFLLTYPGSIYVSEARKRFRRLRGDSNYQ
ncbi:hypothetical protein BFP72_17145 [Reichenbachiella sp. 5M10]|uniref:tetratricopeptide repeat protein n=1 Tax=Reichenbachiella sp. 5M10 TaxID=1889772 RepID=UPI000C3F2584|nr:tetratricopeptide repeat protein [Reichenbachiella sp. 5M10]PIB37005.1 hypothetical protein BFP72_17145 [Reichenbachiella sp. 5M10]